MREIQGMGILAGWGYTEESDPLDWSLADEKLKEARKDGINLEKEYAVTWRQSGEKCRERKCGTQNQDPEGDLRLLRQGSWEKQLWKPGWVGRALKKCV